MRRTARVFLLIALAGCSTKGSTNIVRTDTTQPATLTLVTITSPVLTGSPPQIPVKYTCDGAGTSLPLQWTPTAPVTVDTWTLRIDDPDAPGGVFVHWVVDTIPSGTRASAEGGTPVGGAVRTPYRGPCPPKGAVAHHYIITVTGMREGRPVAKGTLTALYERR
jgi:phosphatidylethanolamine-binding protein (PEBP) family uncharacterized protein